MHHIPAVLLAHVQTALHSKNPKRFMPYSNGKCMRWSTFGRVPNVPPPNGLHLYKVLIYLKLNILCLVSLARVPLCRVVSEGCLPAP